MRYFVTADVHSFYDAMMSALTKQGFDINNTTHKVIILGDAFDRGPDTVKVFQFMQTLDAQKRLLYIYGNHDELFLRCVTNIIEGKKVNQSDFENGTLHTIADITGLNQYDLLMNIPGLISRKDFAQKIAPLYDFIMDKALDYAEIGKYVFVHGWVPCEPIMGEVAKDWDKDSANWAAARWYNGMACWRNGARLPGKIIVCGHWHSAWGHAYIHKTHLEFPSKDNVNWRSSFAPFVDDGIIALDACTAYSGICNCFSFEYNEKEGK